ncbi:TPA: hypothetical protein DDW35_03790 [Candidatus Sumerlaeota bacterium]|nr:hypothetical protein [Candidatus Sumerlaeota bacterium]
MFYFWRTKLTAPGRYAFLGLTVAVLMAMGSALLPIYHFACVLIALFFWVVVGGFVLRPKVSVVSHFPEKASAGQTIRGAFTLTNRSRFLTGYDISGLFFDKLSSSLQPGPQPLVIDALAPGKSADLEVELKALRRGAYVVPRLQAFSTFPFNLWRTQTRGVSQLGKLLVLPRFHPAESITLPGSTRHQPGGIMLTSHIGESPEYIGNREYRPGDSMRRIDFRSWGRLAKPIVREYQEEYYSRIALVFDTFIPGKRKEPPGGFDNLEAAISLAAAVADALARGEYILDIFAAGPELYVFRSGRHTTHFESVLEILSCIDACRTNPFATVTPALADELGNISTVLCVLLDWDASREQLARAAAESGCSVKILIVRDAPTTQPLDNVEAWADSVTVWSPEAIREGRYDVL